MISTHGEFQPGLQTDGSLHHIVTSPLICKANQRAGFYIIKTYVLKELISFFQRHQ